MRDRQPTPGKEGRVLITPEDGSPPFYATLEMADDPLDVGSPYSKGNVLPDDVCELLSIPFTAEPKDAFAAAYLKAINRSLLHITALLPNGEKAPWATISGLPDGVENTCDANGELTVLSAVEKLDLTMAGYLDLIGEKKTVNVAIGNRAKVVLTSKQSTATSAEILTSTPNLMFSPAVATADICSVGGGGGGFISGGGGGYVVTQKGIQRKAEPQDAIVGAGGEPREDGGTTSFYGVVAAGGLKGGYNTTGPEGAGGSGGSGGGGHGGSTFVSDQKAGNGGSDGQDGGNGELGVAGGRGQGTTTKAFGDPDGRLLAGGGGGGSEKLPGKGGLGGGGDGGGPGMPSMPGEPNTGGGGGGSMNSDTGSPGGSGIILVRWVYK